MLHEIPETRLALLDCFRRKLGVADIPHHPQDPVLSKRINGTGEPYGAALDLERIFYLDFPARVERLGYGRQRESSDRRRKHFLNAPSQQIISRLCQQLVMT